VNNCESHREFRVSQILKQIRGLNLSSVYSLYSVSQMSRYREVAPMQVHGHTV